MVKPSDDQSGGTQDRPASGEEVSRHSPAGSPAWRAEDIRWIPTRPTRGIHIEAGAGDCVKLAPGID